MKLSAKQKALLSAKYFELVKKICQEHLDHADLSDEWANLSVDNATEDGELVGIKMDPDDEEWYGFGSEEAFDEFQEEVENVFNWQLASVVTAIGKLEYKGK